MENRRWVIMVVVAAVAYLLLQSLLVPYENALRSLLPEGEVPERAESSFLAVHTAAKSVMVRNPLTVNAPELRNDSMFVVVVNNESAGGAVGDGGDFKGKDRDVENGFATDEKGLDSDFELSVDGNLSSGFPRSENGVRVSDSLALEIVRNQENHFALDEASEGSHGIFLKQIVKPNNGVFMKKNPEKKISLKSESLDAVDTNIQSPLFAPPRTASSITITYLKNVISNASSSVGSVALQPGGATLINDSVTTSSPGKKKMRCHIPPKSITSIYEMNRLLVQHRASSRSTV